MGAEYSPQKEVFMDTIDARLLHLLAEQADSTATALSPMVNLSVPAVNKRISRLKSSGMIQRFTILTDAKTVGKPVMAYILLTLDQYMQEPTLMDYIRSDPDVLECYAVTGEYDYILKVCAAGTEALEEKLIRLKQCRGVTKSHTMLALLEHKFEPIPLPDYAGEK